MGQRVGALRKLSPVVDITILRFVSTLAFWPLKVTTINIAIIVKRNDCMFFSAKYGQKT